jgi:RNA polymerase sigma factor (sigma-70 family)
MELKNTVVDDKFSEPNLASHSNEEVIEWIIDQYGESIVRLAFTYVKDKGRAEDIAQEVFIKCYQHLHTFRGEASLKGWVYKITTNKCKDELRSWTFRKVKPSKYDQESFLTNQSAEEVVHSNQLEERISQAVLSLPVKYREVVILFYYENLPLKEICSMIQKSENTVKTRLRRARQLLKKKLEGSN